MSVTAAREEDLLAIIRDAIGPSLLRRVLVGIGDDAAVWQPSRSHRSAITTDAFVDGVHFLRAAMAPHEIGMHAAAAALSDLAAMGARPLLVTVALGFPPDLRPEELRGLYEGMAAVCTRCGAGIAGGDLVRAPALTLAVTAVGEVRSSNVKRRTGAKIGDVLAVTGPLGAARAGLHLLHDPQALTGALAEEAIAAFRRPLPRWREGMWLAASVHVHAMMDLSDGLSTDLHRLAEASGRGIMVESIPVAPSAQAMALRRGEDPEGYALAGGDDYELLVAVAPRAFPYLASRFRARFGRPLLPVGRVDAESGVRRRTDSGIVPLASTGWDHLR